MLQEFPKTITLANSPYLTMVYITLFLFLGVSTTILQGSFSFIIRDFFSIQEDNYSPKKPSKNLSLIIIGFCGFVLFIFNNISVLDENILPDKEYVNYIVLLKCICYIVCSFIIYVVYKLLIFSIVERLFNISHQLFKKFIAIQWSIFAYCGVILLMLSFVWTYFAYGYNYIFIWIGWVVVGFAVIKLIVKYIQIFNIEQNHLFRFFLYLCTLEFLPILVLVKFGCSLIVE